MKTSTKHMRVFSLAAVATVFLSAGCSATRSTDTATPAPATPAQNSAVAGAPMAPATLTGAQEAPPNTSAARGTSALVVGADQSVTGSVQVSGMTPTMAHIHEAPKGANGPVILPFTKTGDMSFAPAPGARLTDAQYASYRAGNLYINVHSAAYPGGEVRLQLWPR